jgi:hypothetical protein
VAELRGLSSRGLLFPQLRLPAQTLHAICAQRFNLLDRGGHHLFHPLFAKKSGQEQAELKGSKFQEIYQRVQILLGERPAVRHHVQILEVRDLSERLPSGPTALNSKQETLRLARPERRAPV